MTNPRSLIGQTVLKDYIVEEYIGSGGYGDVYKAYQLRGQEKFYAAIKRIMMPNETEYKERLISMRNDRHTTDKYFKQLYSDIISEIALMHQLAGRSAHIVAYFQNEIIEHQNPTHYEIFIAMEFLTTLDDYILKNLITVEKAITMGIEIASSLEVCHSKNILHRDIKEANIFVNDDGVFKLGDFGLAKIINEKSKATSNVGSMVYKAPEVINPFGKYGKTVDIYSLGIVMYLLFNQGRIPFLPPYPEQYGPDDENEALRRRMAGEILPRPSLAKNGIADVILKACHPNPEERYQTASELKLGLSLVLKELPKEYLEQYIDASHETYTQNESFSARVEDMGSTFNEDYKTVNIWDSYCEQPSNRVIPELMPQIQVEAVDVVKKDMKTKRLLPICLLVIGLIVVVGIGIVVLTNVNSKGINNSDRNLDLNESAFDATKEDDFLEIIEKYKPEIPIMNKESGTYDGVFLVDLMNLKQGEEAYFTLEGTSNNQERTAYIGPIEIGFGETLLMIEIVNEWGGKSSNTYSYRVDGQERESSLQNKIQGNIKNGGYVVKSDKGLFYSTDHGIYFLDQDTNMSRKVYASVTEAEFLNVSDNKLYFSVPEFDYSFASIVSLDLVDNTITTLDSNALVSTNLTVIDDVAYYLNDTENIVSIHLKSKEQKIITEHKCTDFFVYGEWIYYINLEDTVSYSFEGMADTVSDTTLGRIHKVRLDGTEDKKVSQAGTYDLYVDGSWLYYANCDDGMSSMSEGASFFLGKLYKINLVTGENVKVSENGVFKLINGDSKNIYYGDIYDVYSLDKMNNAQITLFGSTYGGSILIIDNSLFFKDMNGKTTFSYSQKLESSEQSSIYILNLEALHANPQAGATQSASYILPTSHTEYLDLSDLENYTMDELKLARNEIYARHGYVFKMEIFINYFNSQSWYQPNLDFKESDLNEFEKYNVQLIKGLE